MEITLIASDLNKTFFKTNTKTIFVLEVPRDQDFGLEDCITAYCTLA